MSSLKLIVAVLAVFLAGCASAPPTPQPVPADRTERNAPSVDSPLRGTYWKLVGLGHVAVPAAEGQREAHLIFAGDGSRVSGSGGCNRVSGGFVLDGARLRLEKMLSTRMACPAGMDVEQQFLAALEKVAQWRIRGGHLELADTAGATVARFEAAAQR